MPERTVLRARLARGAGAFVLYDLITGLAAYCVITLAGLWLFSVTWIHIAAEPAAQGTVFNASGHLGLAWVGAVVTLPFAGGIVYLAIRAYGVPRDITRTGGRATWHELHRRFHG